MEIPRQGFDQGKLAMVISNFRFSCKGQNDQEISIFKVEVQSDIKSNSP